ncbi:helix-turn-helix domain-containing protein [Acetobacter sacchari]|uniref:Helix-turn-helix domain-containing protein n=1 Tax=Acetobacter sacchari TaxID=2661687 RepID=A0ABS3M006_9PROT|nr:helix-turn-helix domain-containing protein [Acetobacter sacchari]
MRAKATARAIDAAGGVSALARRVGISAPSVCRWTHIPATRVIAVERVTGIPRAELRPDLYDHGLNGEYRDRAVDWLDESACTKPPQVKHEHCS